MPYSQSDVLILLFYLILTLLVLWTGRRRLKAKDIKFKLFDTYILLLYFILPIFLLALLLNFVENLELVHWIIMGISFAHLFIILFFISNQISNLNKWVPNALITLSLTTMLGLTTLTTISIYSNEKKNVKENELKKVDISEIEGNFNRIRDNIEGLENSIRIETNEIAEISESILSQITDKKKELDNIERKQLDLKAEVEYYKKLANLSKEDANVILRAIQNNQSENRYMEYFIGFVIGIIGGLFSNIIFKRLERILIGMRQKEEIEE